MKQAFYMLVLSVLMTSCATIVNRPYRYTTIHTTEPSHIISKQDTVLTVGNKGELYLHLSLPAINPLLMKPKNERTKAMVGVGGITVGLDYYHSQKQFIHLGVSGLWGGITFKNDELKAITSEYISFSNNHKNRQFSIGYGLSYARNTWYYSKLSWFWFIPSAESIKKSHDAFGLIFPAYYQVREYFKIGIVYRPTFYRPNTTGKFAYEHLISLDFAVKIRLKKW
jgi:hypothetical protein